ncbi:hypothetical protein GCM10017779_31440 [Streptomyces capillispiralis]|nr:hypothetical protein GCM10017779_31440 [Streptomyces capillispiralis]
MFVTPFPSRRDPDGRVREAGGAAAVAPEPGGTRADTRPRTALTGQGRGTPRRSAEHGTRRTRRTTGTTGTTRTEPYVHRGAPAGSPAPIASGAGGRFALAGAKCERRLPARLGPAPEVPPHTPTATRAPRGSHVSTRGPERPTLCRARPTARPWWDVRRAPTAAHPPAAGARELYERHVSTRRRHL